MPTCGWGFTVFPLCVYVCLCLCVWACVHIFNLCGQGLNPCLLHWKHGVLTTGLPGRSHGRNSLSWIKGRILLWLGYQCFPRPLLIDFCSYPSSESSPTTTHRLSCPLPGNLCWFGELSSHPCMVAVCFNETSLRQMWGQVLSPSLVAMWYLSKSLRSWTSVSLSLKWADSPNPRTGVAIPGCTLPVLVIYHMLNKWLPL